MDDAETLDTAKAIRERWPRSKLSLLACHLDHAIDEADEWATWNAPKGGEAEAMKEARKLLKELMDDLRELIPESKALYKPPVFLDGDEN